MQKPFEIGLGAFLRSVRAGHVCSVCCGQHTRPHLLHPQEHHEHICSRHVSHGPMAILGSRCCPHNSQCCVMSAGGLSVITCCMRLESLEMARRALCQASGRSLSVPSIDIALWLKRSDPTSVAEDKGDRLTPVLGLYDSVESSSSVTSRAANLFAVAMGSVTRLDTHCSIKACGFFASTSGWVSELAGFGLSGQLADTCPFLPQR